MEYNNNNIDEIVRGDEYSQSLTRGSLAANLTGGLGYLLGTPIAGVAASAATWGGFVFGTSLISNASMFEQKIIGTGIAAATFMPAYHAIEATAPLVYSQLYTGIGLIKAGAYIAALKPLGIVLVGGLLGASLIWGIQKALKSLVTKSKKKKKKKKD